MLDLERDRFNLEAQSTYRIRIFVVHVLRILVNVVGVLMVVGIICAVVALEMLYEVLNK